MKPGLMKQAVEAETVKKTNQCIHCLVFLDLGDLGEFQGRQKHLSDFITVGAVVLQGLIVGLIRLLSIIEGSTFQKKQKHPDIRFYFHL